MNNIDHFTVAIIRKNSTYILFLAGFTVIFVISILFFISRFNETTGKIEEVTKQNVDLKKKVDALQQTNQLLNQGVNIEEMNKIFSTLIPDIEDYFSILYALEKLAGDTKFIVTDYTINVSASTANILSITVTGEGDTNVFLNFLKDYNFSGARLITVDKIDFSSKQLIGSKLTMNFYSGRTSASSQQTTLVSLTEKDKAILNTIKNKVHFDLTPVATAAAVLTPYPTNANPF